MAAFEEEFDIDMDEEAALQFKNVGDAVGSSKSISTDVVRLTQDFVVPLGGAFVERRQHGRRPARF